MNDKNDKYDYCKLGLAVIETEAQAIMALSHRIGDAFSQACEIILKTKGRVVVLGMGKSGHIASKIAATLASTGTPAFFVHPGEASHGDMGMITPDDCLLAISNSGTTPEILTLLPLIKRMHSPLISLTGDANSSLAKASTVNLDVQVEKEACPLGLAPTASTTATLVMGDALAVALLQARGFSAEDFAKSHPGGKLGRRLLLHVADIMAADDAVPRAHLHTTISEALLEMSSKQLGMTCIVDGDGTIKGIFTDGDLRRTIASQCDIHTTPIHTVMNQQAKTCHQDMLAVDALAILEKNKITQLVVIDRQQRPIGVIHLHQLLSAGV